MPNFWDPKIDKKVINSSNSNKCLISVKIAILTPHIIPPPLVNIWLIFDLQKYVKCLCVFFEVNPCFQRAHIFCMDLQPAADPYNVVCYHRQHHLHHCHHHHITAMTANIIIIIYHHHKQNINNAVLPYISNHESTCHDKFLHPSTMSTLSPPTHPNPPPKIIYCTTQGHKCYFGPRPHSDVKRNNKN